jgi:flagellar biosynthesis/type III secretory pathway chaperone
MNDSSQSVVWDAELAQLLAELSDIQTDLLAVLTDKRARLLSADLESLKAMQGREAELVGRLQACHERRLALLARAASEGLPSANLTSLAAALPSEQRQHLTPQLREASARIRLLQHHSLTNWVLVQRTLLHLAQLLEIIATGGRLKPTYGKNDCAQTGGSLVDQAV